MDYAIYTSGDLVVLRFVQFPNTLKYLQISVLKSAIKDFPRNFI